ncbi:activator-dependent family glycosyltransferase [Nonomuraea sp. MCN248]|uniref:Activator-dependent family glycosyltransferase n=1 Tax=Nonomuraea corallina TaxID=2989783 RepID=A0ABT4SMC0_9ACTN|nr:activator-dependent family glycosyltransferase [Nonomuraea corallina]MDA0638391.1 activator-dependent family glycosyltransferase [Nonomuraea corallina]
MRVLIATYSEKTHFLGMVPMAWALATAGHEVRVATQPESAAFFAGTGLATVSVGRDHSLYRRHQLARLLGQEEADGFLDIGDRWPPEHTWEQLRWGFREVVSWWWKVINEPMIGELTDFCRWWRPDLVIWEPGTFAAAIAADACGAVHGRLLWSLDLFAQMRHRYLTLMRVQPPDEREDVLMQWLGARAAAHGGTFREEMVTGHFTIDHLPPSLRLGPPLDQRGFSLRYIPYNGRAVLPGWLREPPDRPRVCLSLGTSATERLGGYAVPVAELLEALEDLDVEVVATIPEPEQARLGRVPGNARLVGFVPLHALAATCTAMINHGGPGTVCTGLAYGVPQLVLPVDHLDAPLLAKALAAQGAGLSIPSGQVTPSAVRDALGHLLAESSFEDNAMRLREEMLAMRTPNELAVDLEDLVAGLRGR